MGEGFSALLFPPTALQFYCWKSLGSKILVCENVGWNWSSCSRWCGSDIAMQQLTQIFKELLQGSGLRIFQGNIKQKHLLVWLLHLFWYWGLSQSWEAVRFIGVGHTGHKDGGERQNNTEDNLVEHWCEYELHDVM